jgi:hypothetical protein
MARKTLTSSCTGEFHCLTITARFNQVLLAHRQLVLDCPHPVLPGYFFLFVKNIAHHGADYTYLFVTINETCTNFFHNYFNFPARRSSKIGIF